MTGVHVESCGSRRARYGLLMLAVLWIQGSVQVASASEQLARGRIVYNENCYFCHGYSGNAKTAAAAYLAPAPRDFTAAVELSESRMRIAVRNGRTGTAMPAFARRLSEQQMVDVVAFVRDEFMLKKAPNGAYHSRVNGWIGDPRAAPGAAVVTGEVALQSEAERRESERAFGETCAACHERSDVADVTRVWQNESVSFPYGNYIDHEDAPGDPVIALFALHSRPRPTDEHDQDVRTGERLYLDNCAHCHAADGTGRNWVGSFLSPSPGSFVEIPRAPRDDAYLREVIRNGIAGSAMPAWRTVLSSAQVDALTAYMRSTFKRYSTQD